MIVPACASQHTQLLLKLSNLCVFPLQLLLEARADLLALRWQGSPPEAPSQRLLAKQTPELGDLFVFPGEL